MVQVVCGAISRDGELLIALRGRAMRDPGCWEFPGGKIEPGESHSEALIRELSEELGVQVSVGEHVDTSDDGRIELHTYRCRIQKGEPQPLEHAELRWVGPESLIDYHFAPADAGAVQALTRTPR